MKKTYFCFSLFFLFMLLTACGGSDDPISTTRPLPPYESSVQPETESKELDSQEETEENQTYDDKRDEPEVIRQEVANMLRDAESLISEGLHDDARMVLRDLRSRELTDAEEKKVNDLLSRLITISD